MSSSVPRPAPKSHGRKSIAATPKPRALMTEAPDLAGVWKAQIITLFPEVFPGVLGASLTGKALQKGLWQLETLDLRLFGEGKHRNVDDTPAGGGPGMVLRADVVGRAVEAARRTAPGLQLLYLSPRGRPLTQARVRALAQSPGAALLCGRFEGVDERVLEHYGIEEVSIGDYVLTGGELAAQVLIDATVRLLPGVLGNEASSAQESFSSGLLEHPQYTRPAVWEGREIPQVLHSGHHSEIDRWRHEAAERLTRARRPDLWCEYARDI
ncbi:MAG: tRNA (guanosine(37)-N1)-methyltransferase TrmD [Pseudomonadota bacterium]